jgi:serine phosphatase RsbU (regulator of sigma subunit)
MGAGLAAAWLAVLVVADIVVPGPVALSVLFALAPLVACAVLPVPATGAFAVAAVVLTVLSGLWNDNWGDAQQAVRIVDVILISVAAVLVAIVRVRREQRYERVVVIAEVAQRAILPTLPRQVGPVAIGARYLSAAQDAVVGGDLYDCYHSDQYMRFLVGDVRGKGIGAVEQAARVIRAFRQSAATQPTLAGVAREMSGYLAPFFDDEEFVTGLLVDATDPSCLTLVSCGHPPALLLHDGRATLVEAPAGIPLGLGDGYEELRLPWQPGDRLLMYTDGLSEARDRDGEFLPLTPLASVLTGGPVDAALDALMDTVQAHVPGGQLGDDLAVLLLENVGVSPQAEPEGSHSSPRGVPVSH